MNKMEFTVTLLEPMMLPDSDKTETSLNCLDYIPGNKFWGLVAGALYDEKNPAKTLDIFHNGNVQFGNAYLSIKGKQSLPVPSIIYKVKGDDISHTRYLYHLLDDNKWDDFTNNGIQIKQERAGYFVNVGGVNYYATVKMGAALKSEYDNVKRSAKSQQMFLNNFIEPGQKFVFEVRATEVSYLEEISNALIGKKSIAKSNGAEYGGVLIEKTGEGSNDEDNYSGKTGDEEGIVVYAKSNLAFINRYGEFTWLPDAMDLGFNNGTIDYEKSQILFDKFHTRNGKRKTHDADRLIIRKGSVFIITGNPVIDTEKVKRGVGVFLSEGFGQILINPDFINDSVKFVTIEPDVVDLNTGSRNPGLAGLLKERYEDRMAKYLLYEEVAKFIDDNKNLYGNISASQWGAIRTYIYEAKSQNNLGTDLYDSLFNFDSFNSNKNGFFYHGKLKERWSGFKIIKLIDFAEVDDNKRTIGCIDKLLLLTIEMPKHQKKPHYE